MDLYDNIDLFRTHAESENFDRDLVLGELYMSQRNSPDRFDMAEKTYNMSNQQLRTYALNTYNRMR